MTRKLILSFLLLGTFCLFSKAQRTINDGWLFEGMPVAIPHTWNTDSYHDKSYRKGTFVYEREIIFPQNDSRKILRFDGVFKVADVWMNGHKLGRHKGGYTGFAFDVTPFVIAGRNRVKVVVSNHDDTVPPVSADFTFMGGIYRDVWLIEKSHQHFEVMDGMRVMADTTRVRIDCRLRNEASRPQTGVLSCRLKSADGKLLGSTRKKVRMTVSEQISLTLPAPECPHLWSPEHPYLYKVEATLYAKDGKAVLDTETQNVAIRWYGFDADKGFMLNGKPYKLHGVCIHQDQQPYGIALDDDQHRRDFRLMKAMGANFVRLAHYPQDDAILELCDREGMLVWEEIPVVDFVPEGEDFADNCQQQLREMIRQHASHPSIILWGYMNEILLRTSSRYQGEALDAAYRRTLSLARLLEQMVHEEDPSRLSAMAFHGSDIYHEKGLGEVPKVIGWNLYQGWYGSSMTDFEKYLERQHLSHPARPIIVSEYGAGSDLRLHHPQGGQAFDFSVDYQQKYIEHYLPVIERTPYVSGGAYWNFIDFASANRDESMPRINNKGIVTADRTPKDVYYYFQSCWRRDLPVVHLAVRDWPKRQTSEMVFPVKVYTNQPQVELVVNGQSLGTKNPHNCMAVFDVRVKEGENVFRALAGQAEDVAIIFCHSPIDISVNVGSNCYYQSAKSGVTWQPDRPYASGSYGYIGGKAVQTQTEILLTEDNPLYQTMREGLDGYRFDVPAGTYELELLMTDIHQHQQSSAYLLGREDGTTDADSHFQISINGQLLESDYHPERKFSAVRKRYIIQNMQDHIQISFTAGGYLSGIQLRKK